MEHPRKLYFSIVLLGEQMLCLTTDREERNFLISRPDNIMTPMISAWNLPALDLKKKKSTLTKHWTERKGITWQLQ